MELELLIASDDGNVDKVKQILKNGGTDIQLQRHLKTQLIYDIAL